MLHIIKYTQLIKNIKPRQTGRLTRRSKYIHTQGLRSRVAGKGNRETVFVELCKLMTNPWLLRLTALH